MPVIRISNEAMERLKRWAEPLEDTTESAFDKVLDAAEQTSRPPGPAPPEPPPVRPPGKKPPGPDKLPEEEFRRPLMEVLYELGGGAHLHEVRPLLKKRIDARLRPGDYERVATGDPRWWNAACWARHGLRKDGYLRDGSPRGHWELSEKGMRQVQAWQSEESAEVIGFIDQLMAMPDVGEDSDFDRPRSGPRRVQP